jgi:hypothetical protein
MLVYESPRSSIASSRWPTSPAITAQEKDGGRAMIGFGVGATS